MTERQEILELAPSLFARRGGADREATNRNRRLLNTVVFERLAVKGGRLYHE